MKKDNDLTVGGFILAALAGTGAAIFMFSLVEYNIFGFADKLNWIFGG